MEDLRILRRKSPFLCETKHLKQELHMYLGLKCKVNALTLPMPLEFYSDFGQVYIFYVILEVLFDEC